MPDKNYEKKEKNLFGVFENFSFRKVFRYNIIFLLLFLIFIGVTSYFVLTQEGSKLAGFKKGGDFSSNFKGERFNLIEKIKYFFVDEDESLAYNDSRTKNGDYIDEKEKSDNSKSKLSSNLSDRDKDSNTKSFSSSYSQNFRPQKNIESSLISMGSIQSSNQSQTSLSNFDYGSKADVRIGTKQDKFVVQKPKGNESKSALDLLKNTYKSTLYAARDASNDTARSWTAKAFDLTPDIKETIEYDEKLRAKLDRINPNSIPSFLKDPSLDAESMRSLKASDVPGLDKDSEENPFDIDISKIKQMEKQANSKLNTQTNNSMINPMFNAFSNNNVNNPKSATSPTGETVTQPSSEPKLDEGISNVTTDEYGYIRVTGDDGMVQIFDPNSGKIVGCEDSNAGMCLMPGAENCPSDVYFV